MTRPTALRRATRHGFVGAALVVVAAHVVPVASPSRATADVEAATPASTSTEVVCPRDQVLVTAHRGTGSGTRTIGGRVFSENTLPAFREALDLGVDGVEADYWPTSDGQVVVHHDETLDRMTTGHGRIEDHTWAEVSRLRHASGAGIPRFDTVAAALAGTGGHRQQEVKHGAVFSDRLLHEMVRTDVATGSYDHLLYTSSELRTLRRLHAVDPLLPLGLITRTATGRPALERLPEWLDVVLIDLRAADADYVARAAALGYAVSLRGVDTAAQLGEAVRLGAQRVLTNRPEALGPACRAVA